MNWSRNIVHLQRICDDGSLGLLFWKKQCWLVEIQDNFFWLFTLYCFVFVRINLHTYIWSKALSLCFPEIFNLVLNRKLIVLCLILLGMQLSGSIFVHMEPWTIEIKKYMCLFTHSIFLLPMQQLLLSCSQNF